MLPAAFAAAVYPENAAKLSATNILSRGISALGGLNALESLRGISYHSNLLRSQTLEESVIVQGSQTLSYDLSSNSSDVIQRIDKLYTISDFFNFARPSLDPFDVSLVVRGGASGYACYVKGNEHVFNPPDNAFGYTDAFLANVLVRDATRLSPKLLLNIQKHQWALSTDEIYYHSAGPYPSVHDHSLNLTVLFDPETYLPFVVRAYENHRIFGPSTNDYILANYSVIDGLRIPQTVHTLYNEGNLLFHTIRDAITINPQFEAGYFDGLSNDQIGQTGSQLKPTPAESSSEYDPAEVFENNENLVWYGPYPGSLETLNVSRPVAGLPNFYNLVFEGSIYACTVGIFDDAIIVADAAPHQSKLVIQWIKQTFHRRPTHLLISHHHHDHNYGAADFVEAGAVLVVPKGYEYYWQNIPGVKFALSEENKPFIHKDKHMQVRAIWHPGFVHASDWMYFMWTTACPTANSPVVATLADAWSPGFIGYEFDNNLAISYLNFAAADRMPHDYLVVPIHGSPHNISELYTLTGYAYPKYKTTDFRTKVSEREQDYF
ncbi:hypothetical protein TrVGV298_002267 [Trichoderma virens]|nr:hypothetical protein TrVGV298_002267 [Trichoderma virens]